ncbi:MAG: hypothetical protein ABW321_03125 [Polyangiales bacterium]
MSSIPIIRHASTAAWLVSLALAACNIDVPSGVYRCSEDAACPPSQFCHADGVCRATPARDAGPSDAGEAESGKPEPGDGGDGAAADGGVNGGRGDGGEGGSDGGRMDAAVDGKADASPDAAHEPDASDACPSGYTRNISTGECEDSDECAADSDDCSAEPDACVNEKGGYRCECPADYIGTGRGPAGCNRRSCEPDNGGCEQQCTSTDAGVSCGCDEGAVLKDDAKNCWSWHPAVRIPHEVPGIGNYSLLVALDGSGDGTALWAQDGLFSSLIKAGEWETPVYIGAEPGSDPESLALGPAGEVFAAYVLGDALYVTRRTADGTWDTSPSPLATPEQQSVWGPQLAADGKGNALVGWRETVPRVANTPDEPTTRSNACTSRYTKDVGWSSPARLEQDDRGDANEPSLELNAAGSGFAIWSQSEGFRHSVWVSHFVPDSGFADPIKIEASDEEISGSPTLAIDPDGNAIAAWATVNADETRMSLWVNRFRARSGWSNARILVEFPGGSYRNVKAVLDMSGNGFVTWSQHDGSSAVTSSYTQWSARFLASGDFGAPEQLVTGDRRSASVNLALNRAGGGLGIWTTSDEGTGYSIWSAHFHPKQGWQTPRKIDSSTQSFASAVHITFDDQSVGRAYWIYDGAIWTATYD